MAPERLVGLVPLLVLACARNAGGEDGPLDADPPGDATVDPEASAGGDAATTEGPIEIRPTNLVLMASGIPVAQHFDAFDTLTQTRLTASWKLSANLIGDVESLSGAFTANGGIGGVATLTATSGGRTATTTITVNVSLSDDPGSVSSLDQAKLRAGGTLGNDPSFRWLYPYDATVFPRGLRAPLLQFGGAGAEAMYVRVDSAHLKYEAFFGPSDPLRIALDQARWRTLTGSAGGTDTVSVSVTKLSGGVATGPIRQTWIVAQGSLRGTVYYNTYKTAQAGGDGALVKVRPGSAEDAQVLVPTCTVCHSVSANGNVVVAGTGWGNGNPTTSGVFSIGASGAPLPGYSEALGRFAFGGLTPDGTYMMSSAVAPGGIRGLAGSTGSSLHDTQTGQKKSAPGWDGIVFGAQMPSFSPDGKFIVFNDRDDSAGHTLTVMTFDPSTLSFGTKSRVWSDTAALLAWPAFVPDSKAIVFHAGSAFGTEGSTADVEIADIATKTRQHMPALNGFLGNDQAFGPTFLPYGESSEGHLNYEPTVLPVAVGGYYWVVFTSRRCYGNAITTSTDRYAELSPRKKLWVAAIDMAGTPGIDRSHPAFYLPGQDISTGNMRGFWALDPCRPNGQDCESGDECCGGYCRAVASDGGVLHACASTPSGCALDLEKCATANDCCGNHDCVNGRCAAPPPK